MAKRSYSSFVSPKNAPVNVTEKSREDMVQNSDVGYVFSLDSWKKLDRFLILGVESNTYYTSRSDLVRENATNVLDCIKLDGVKTVNRITEISQDGRAPKNDPAIFALALAVVYGDSKTRKAFVKNFDKVIRIGTHLLQFHKYVKDLNNFNGSAGRSAKEAVNNWLARDPAKLSYQVIKYFNRNGWTFADVLKVVHPKPVSDTHNDIFKYIIKGWESVGEQPHDNVALQSIWAAERAKSVTKGSDIANLVSNYNLPWEALDTKWLNDHDVWDSLLNNIGPEALMRNLSRLSANGFLKPLSNNVDKVCDILTDEDRIKNARLHPLKLLVASSIYGRGYGDKGSLTWKPNSKIVAALESAFYKSFKYVEAANKRTLLALDISGSMGGGSVAGSPLCPRDAAAALAMTIARTEPKYHFVGFSNDILELNINHRMTLNEVIKYTSDLPFGSTNIGSTFTWMMKNNVHADTVIVVTDNEVNSGSHPYQLLKQYRNKMNIPTRLVVVGMTSTGFTIADPTDPLQMDVVGFDLNSPQLITDFSAGRI